MSRLLTVIRNVLSWPMLIGLSLGTLLAVVVTPGVERRRSIARKIAHTVLRIAGVRLTIKNTNALPGGACVIVANHTTYLDGLILTAALPPRFAFVIKREMAAAPLVGLLLRRIGSEFVDRFNRHRGAMDTRRVLRRASEGQALVFFPEGTFSKQPGLLRFHTGAFVTAVRANCPVVPVIIRGARDVLAYDRIIATPGVIEVEILDAVPVSPADREAAMRLRDATRRRMLEKLGEPDLAHLSHVAPVLPAHLVKRA